MTAAGATALGYDGRGNLISSGSSSYDYTSENRLATTGSGAYLAYDVIGRLVQVYANPEADCEFEILDRQKPGQSLRESEQRQIVAHGRPTNKSNPNGGTENMRHEIAPCGGTRIGNNGSGSIC